MNTNTGQLYPDYAGAFADLKPGESESDIVELIGNRSAIERLAREVQQHKAARAEAALAARDRDQADRDRKDTTMTGIELIAAERTRQVEAEGWTPEHDAAHGHGVLAAAARCYATPEGMGLRYRPDRVPLDWPWDARFWKPTPDDRVRELVKAGALIAAEIDRVRAVERGTK